MRLRGKLNFALRGTSSILQVTGNFAGGLLFAGLMLYVTHYRTAGDKVAVNRPVRLGADSGLGKQKLEDVGS